MNNKTTLAGLAQFISSLVFAIVLVVYAIWTKTPLQVETFTGALFVVVFGALSWLKGALAADSSNPFLRVAAKLFPSGEEKDIANALTKNIAKATETAVESYEKPREPEVKKALPVDPPK